MACAKICSSWVYRNLLTAQQIIHLIWIISHSWNGPQISSHMWPRGSRHFKTHFHFLKKISEFYIFWFYLVFCRIPQTPKIFLSRSSLCFYNTQDSLLCDQLNKLPVTIMLMTRPTQYVGLTLMTRQWITLLTLPFLKNIPRNMYSVQTLLWTSNSLFNPFSPWLLHWH